MRVCLGPNVLVINEFGVWRYDRTAATALFTLISAGYKRGSVILNRNESFAEWGDVLGDGVIAAAILDRLLHHSHVLTIQGESGRLREKRQAGLYGTGQAANTPTDRCQTDTVGKVRGGVLFTWGKWVKSNDSFSLLTREWQRPARDSQEEG